MIHVETTIEMPSKAKAGSQTRCSDRVITFDRGAASRRGTGGFLVWGLEPVLWRAEAIQYGDQAPTNNVTQGFALIAALEWLAIVDVASSMCVLVLGNS